MRRHPFVFALGGVTARQFAVGALVALAATAVFVTYRVATREELHPQAEWMTEADQERLYQALTTLAGGDWAAGCIWERKWRPVEDVMDVPVDATSYVSGTDGPRPLSFATSITEARTNQSFDEVSGDGYLCYVPMP